MSATEEVEALALEHQEAFKLMHPGVKINPDGVLLGHTSLMKDWADQFTRESSPEDMFYAFGGMTSNTGAGFCMAGVAGLLAGTYEGLRKRGESGAMLTYRTAGQAAFHFGTQKASLYANRVGAAAFTVGVIEGVLRRVIISKAAAKYQFKDYKEEDLAFYETDSRKLAPISALIAMPLLRFRRQPHTVVASTVLMAAACAAYAHCWSAEEYFDIRRGWDTPPSLVKSSEA
eukprot:Rhum_TRINITY_DN15649_c0_g1::Rhum_TRINITY_DN15649_c0_g1_i1::g.161760::m.161760